MSSFSLPTPSVTPPSIFREYIGFKSSPKLDDFPDQMINPDIKEFHFIVAFAVDKTGTGDFSAGWATLFDAEKIKNLKQKFEQKRVDVKVILSIGGRGSRYPFNTHQKFTWIAKAKASLTKIITGTYGNAIDGIDVNYETIESTEDDFVDSIGNLIQQLKDDKNLNVKVASIAPSQSVKGYYKTLYKNYGNNIDWVDYQFYDQIDPIPSGDDLVTVYKSLLGDYPNGKLLAGFSTDPNDAGKIDPQEFLNGCVSLLKEKLLPGIFAWDAEDSSNTSFQFEKIAQQYLVEHQTHKD